MTDDKLLEAIGRFVNAETWSDAQHIVEAHPELLESSVDDAFERLLDQFRDNEDALHTLTEHWELLRSCRELGTEQAFASKLRSMSWLTRLREAAEEKGPKAMAAEDALPMEVKQQLSATHTLKQLAQLADRHPELRHLLRVIDLQNIREMAVTFALIQLLQAESPEEARGIIDENPELLCDECEVLLTQLIEHCEDAAGAAPYTRIQDLLRHCRDVGIGKAFMDISGIRVEHSSISPELLRILGGPASEGEKREQLTQLIREDPDAVRSLEDDFSHEPLIAAGFALIGTRSMAELVQVAAEHPILLSRQADKAMRAAMAFAPSESEDLQVMERLRQGLQWLRGLGAQVDQVSLLAEVTAQGLIGDEDSWQVLAEREEYRAAALLVGLTQCHLPNLACQVLDGDLSLPDAMQATISEVASGQPQLAEIRTLDAYIVDHLNQYPQAAREAYVLAELNCALAQHLAEPEVLATSLNTLGLSIGVYVERYPQEERTVELSERSVWAWQRAAEISNQLGDKKQLAGALVGLGAALQALPVGKQEENLGRAIECYTEAAACCTAEIDPVKYAKIQSALGHAYTQLAQVQPGDNLQRAILCYREAATHISPKTDLSMYVQLRTLLGIAYSQIPRARDENLRKAISCYEEVIQVCSTSDLPEEHAIARVNLGVSYMRLPSGNRQDNLEKAIDCLELALTVCTQERIYELYAMAQANLGSAYGQYSRGDREYNLRRAIFCYSVASRYYTKTTFPFEHARLQSSRGLAHAELAKLIRQSRHLDRAMSYLNEALNEYMLQDAVLECASVKNNLGYAYRVLVELEGQPQQLHEAIGYFTQALTLLTPQIAPLECQRTAMNLGDLYATDGADLGLTERERWERAYEAYALASEAADELYRSGWTTQGKEAEQRRIADISQRIVACCLHLIEICPDRSDIWRREALVRIENGRARLFVDQLAQADYPPPAEIPQDLLLEERAVLAQLRELEQVETAVGRTAIIESSGKAEMARLTEERGQVQRQIQSIWTQMLHCSSAAAEYVSLRRAEPLGWEDLAWLVETIGAQGALVELYTTMEAIGVFVMRAGWSSPLFYSIPLTQTEFYFRYALNYQDEVINWTRCQEAYRPITRAWQLLGERIFRPLWDELADALSGTELLYLIPHGNLHFLPLHALTVCGETLLDRWAVAYAPSAGILASVLKHEKHRADGALVLGYTPSDPSTHEGRLEHELFLGEAADVAEHFGVRPWLGNRATFERLTAEGTHAQVIHLSCHGSFDAEDPLASGVELADGSVSVLEWMRLNLVADLITLSACETGISDVQTGEELIGLTRGILYAGASSALVTLWSVNAQSTRALMVDFYRRGWRRDRTKLMPKALALRQAVLEVRGRYPDPYFWAPFMLVGDWQ